MKIVPIVSKLTIMRVMMTKAAIEDISPASVSKASPIDSPRDKVVCVAESPIIRLMAVKKLSDILFSDSVDYPCALGDKHPELYRTYQCLEPQCRLTHGVRACDPCNRCHSMY